MRRNEGITLIALIITIIILLILAGVSIAILDGENGIIKRVTDAKEKTEIAEEKELLEISVLAALVVGNGELNTANLNKEVKANINKNAEVTETSSGWLYKSKKSYTISKEGEIREKVEIVLPTEYQRVEFIQSSKIQYIDTNYLPKSNKIRIVTDYIYYRGNALDALFGMYNKDGKNGEEWIITAFGGSNLKFYVGNSGSILQINNTVNVKHHLDITANEGDFTVDFDGEISNATYMGNIAKTYANYLFAQQNGVSKTAEGGCNMCLYTYTIYDNDKKVRDFIPCYRKSDGEVGLYDIIENVFYTNAGQGSFEKGEDIKQ